MKKNDDILAAWSCLVAALLIISDLACWVAFLRYGYLGLLVPAVFVLLAMVVMAILVTTTDWSK